MIDLLAPITDSITIDYSTKCNLRCTYCHTGSPEYEIVDMTPQMVSDIYDYCVEEHVGMVCTSGNGETTMFTGWQNDLAQFLDTPKFRLQINSNFAREFTDDDLLGLNKHDHIQLSIDSASAVLMKKQRTADLRTIISNMVRLRALMLKTGKKTTVEINCTLTRDNINDIGDLARLAVALQVDSVMLTEMMAWNNNPKMPDGLKDLTDDEAATLVRSISDAMDVLQAAKINIRLRPGLIAKLKPVADAINNNRPPTSESLRKEDNEFLSLQPCLQPWTYAMVVAGGGVQVCCGHSDTIGNIKETSLHDILNGKEARKMRQDLLDGTSSLPCSWCWAAQPKSSSTLEAQVASAQYAAAARKVAAAAVKPAAAVAAEPALAGADA